MKDSPELGIVLRGLLLFSSVFIIVQTYLSLADYLQYRTEIDVRIKQEIAPFPAVTVCTDFSDSQFMDRGYTIDKEPALVQLSNIVLSGTFNRDFLSMPASAQDFREHLNVEYSGHYFTFNWKISSGLRAAKPGAMHGLRLMLNTNTSGSSKSGRVRIVVHEQGVAPVPHQSGLTASLGDFASIGFKQKCRSDCIISRIFIACDCAFPPNPLIKHNPHQCNTTEQRNCLNRERRSRENDHANCNCAPDCEESIYETISSTSSLPTIVSDCSLSKSTEEECTDYESTNIAVVEVYPTQNHYEMLVERPAYPLPRLLSEVARNGILLLLIVIMTVMMPARAGGRKDRIVYEKAPLTSS